MPIPRLPFLHHCIVEYLFSAKPTATQVLIKPFKTHIGSCYQDGFVKETAVWALSVSNRLCIEPITDAILVEGVAAP